MLGPGKQKKGLGLFMISAEALESFHWADIDEATRLFAGLVRCLRSWFGQSYAVGKTTSKVVLRSDLTTQAADTSA